MYNGMWFFSRSWSERSILIVIALVAFIAVIAMDVWSYQQDLIVGYGDAASHLAISRRIVDNGTTPGLGQLGTSWLPALHLLMLPFIWRDGLWLSGFAGTIVSNLAYVGAVIYCYCIARTILEKRLLALAITATFALNPNMLYMATTAMNEVLYVFSVLASIAHILWWARNPARYLHLIVAASFAFLTAFNRYEGWFLVIGQAISVYLVSWKIQGRNYSAGIALLFAYIAFAAPVLWIAWNFFVFGDPFDFLHNAYTSRGSQLSLEAAGLLPTKGNILVATEYLGRAMTHTVGGFPTLLFVVAVLVSLGYYGYIVLRKKDDEQGSDMILAAALLVPALFLILTLIRGVTALHVPDVPPFGIYNVRYGLFILPAVIVFVMLLVRHSLRWHMGVALFVITIMGIGTAHLWLSTPITIVEARENYRNNSRHQVAAKFLRDHYQGEPILLSAGTRVGNPFIHQVGLPMRTMIHEGNQDIWRSALENPQDHAGWIVMTEQDSKRDIVAQTLLAEPRKLAAYDLAFEQFGISVYRRLSAQEVQAKEEQAAHIVVAVQETNEHIKDVPVTAVTGASSMVGSALLVVSGVVGLGITLRTQSPGARS